jgi:hypothetical protein
MMEKEVYGSPANSARPTGNVTGTNTTKGIATRKGVQSGRVTIHGREKHKMAQEKEAKCMGAYSVKKGKKMKKRAEELAMERKGFGDRLTELIGKEAIEKDAGAKAKAAKRALKVLGVGLAGGAAVTAGGAMAAGVPAITSKAKTTVEAMSNLRPNLTKQVYVE